MATIEQKKIQKNAPSDSKFNTEVMIPISEIKDGVIIMKDWGIRSILKVEGLNLDLKNFDEIQVIFEQYKRFLNSLNFPIQILVRNTYLDLTNYLNYIKENIEKININALKQQGEEYYKFLERIDTNQGLIFVKEFYIIVPFYSEGKETEQINKSRMEKFMNFLESKDEIEVIVDRYRKSYFCIYLPLERNNDAENVYSLFKTDIKNNIVTEGSMLSSILTDYIDRELSEENFPMEHLYSKGEDAIQGVFNKLHREGKYSKYITK